MGRVLEYECAEKKSLENCQGEGGGRLPKSSDQAWSQFRSCLEQEEQKHFTGKELWEKFCIHPGGSVYSMGHFCRLLREKMGMYFYKPEPRDYRRPENAEEKLSQRLAGLIDALKAKGLEPEKIAIGFADEAAAQFLCNNARFWSLEPHVPRKCNSDGGSQKFFGFYAIRGNSVLVGMQECNKHTIMEAAMQVRQANLDYQAVVMIWDNAKAHKSVEAGCWMIGVHTVSLPAYSPDLNPLERVWKAVKRKVNQQGCLQTVQELSEAFHEAFQQAKTQMSFAEGWLEDMQSIISWFYPTKMQEDMA